MVRDHNMGFHTRMLRLCIAKRVCRTDCYAMGAQRAPNCKTLDRLVVLDSVAVGVGPPDCQRRVDDSAVIHGAHHGAHTMANARLLLGGIFEEKSADRLQPYGFSGCCVLDTPTCTRCSIRFETPAAGV